MPIERDIHELLFCHDCVIVPQWGGFLTHYRPARLDEARKIVHPPGEDTSFNRNLTRNDGLLADHIAKRKGIPFDRAAAQIAVEVDNWRTKLARDGRLELPQIGIFYHDEDHLLQFDPDKRTDHLKDAYGLRPVIALPVVPLREVPVIPLVPEPVEAPVAATVRSMTAVWAAAAVVVLLLGAGTIWFSTQGPDGQLIGQGPFKTVPRSYVPVTLEPRAIAQASILSLPEEALGVQRMPLKEDDSVMITVDLGTPMVEDAAPDTTRVAVVIPPPAPTAVPSTERLRFHVVGGCFAQPENADRFLEELLAKGFPAQRLPQRGDLHPVVFGSYANRGEAMEAMEHVRATAAGQAWLMVR